MIQEKYNIRTLGPVREILYFNLFVRLVVVIINIFHTVPI